MVTVVLNRTNAREALFQLLDSSGGEGTIPRPSTLLDDTDGLRAWLKFGDYLRKKYEFQRYAFVQWTDEARENLE